MSLWDKIRGLFRRRTQSVYGVGPELTQADLRAGEVIRPEQMIRHVVSVAFPRAAVDDETFRRLSDRGEWKKLLTEDRTAATREDHVVGLDDMLLGLVDQEVLVTLLGPEPCPPLPIDTLQYTAIGFNEPFLDLAERCDHMVGFAVCAPNESPMRLVWPLAHHLARLAARETGGLVFEHLSLRWWSLERWAAVNPYPGQGWIGDWVTIHGLAEEAGPGDMHTHGMLHFGLPELELVNVARFHGTGAGKLINTACRVLILRALAENSEVRVGEEVEITGDDVRAAHRVSAEEEPTEGRTSIRLVAGDPEAALVENRLLRIVPGAEYADGSEGLAGCLHDLFPEEDEIHGVADQEAMEAAHLKAMETLPAERARFRRGLRPAERLAVKIPFPYGGEDDHEYMWVEVQQWNGEGADATIEGILLNDPAYRPDLKLGQSLTVAQRDVYDWMRITPGGRHEGNFTAAALE